MIKKILTSIAIILPMVYCMTGSAFAAENNSLSIDLNGTKINACAYEQQGMLYLPLRAVCDALGYTVEWSAKDHAVSVVKPQEEILLNFDTFSITEGGHQYYMDSQVLNGTSYISEEFFNDSMGLKITQDQSEKSVSLESVKENEVTIETVKEISGETKIDITLQYPKISGLKDQKIQDKINAVLKQEAVSAKNEGLKYVKDSWDDNIPNKFETYFDYRIKYNQNNLLSVVFLDYQYTGGAHGDTIQKSYTIDLQTGREYSIKDLFKADSNYGALFNDLVKSEIAERELYELTTFGGISVDQIYYLDNDGVTVYFEPYEYFPYAAGIQTFTASYSDLKEMLDPSLSFLCKDTISLEPKTQNILSVGDIGKVALEGNATTGYEWQYTIEDNSIVALDTESSVVDSNLIGAGSTYTWNFKALKPGETKIILKYYRSWEGESAAIETVEYLVKVN